MAEPSLSDLDTQININVELHRQLSRDIIKAGALARLLFEGQLLDLKIDDPAFGYLWTLIDLVIDIDQAFNQKPQSQQGDTRVQA